MQLTTVESGTDSELLYISGNFGNFPNYKYML
jgi:hypothetical protein